MTDESAGPSGRWALARWTAEIVLARSRSVGPIQTRFVTVAFGSFPSRTDLACKSMLCINFRLAHPKQHREVGCTEGNFQAYIEDLKKRKGPDSDQPHRVTYRKLVRG